MKKLITLLTAVCLCLSLGACGKSATPEEKVAKFMDDFKNGTLSYNIEGNKLDNSTAIYKANQSVFKYEIVDTSEVDDRTVEVKVNCTYLDGGTIFKNALVNSMRQNFSAVMGGNTPSEDEKGAALEAAFNEELEKEDKSTITEDLIITCVANGSQWDIKNDDTLLKLLSLNMIDTLKALG